MLVLGIGSCSIGDANDFGMSILGQELTFSNWNKYDKRYIYLPASDIEAWKKKAMLWDWGFRIGAVGFSLLVISSIIISARKQQADHEERFKVKI